MSKVMREVTHKVEVEECDYESCHAWIEKVTRESGWISVESPRRSGWDAVPVRDEMGKIVDVSYGVLTFCGPKHCSDWMFKYAENPGHF